MDFIWILVAFICGFLIKQLGLPPLIGYLAAGFALNAWGMQSSQGLEVLADSGITLLLFTIGLKVNWRDLMHREVLVSAIGHISLWTLMVTILLGGLFSLVSHELFNLSWQSIAMISFALCFSSTVCIAKVLEDKGELKTRHGKIAIGVLVIQDIVAVLFLVAALGKLPSIWAVLLLLLLPLRPLIGRLLEKSGHGELLALVGFFLAFGSYELFSSVDMKGDLGALIMGILLSSHPKSSELYKALMSFKDLFLIGFFLSIGFTALPSVDTFVLALFLIGLLFIKFILFYGLFYFLNLRSRTSFLTSLSLMNYSEFGLIVAVICVDNAWLSNEWLVAIALAVAISFLITSYAFKIEHTLFVRNKTFLSRFQRATAMEAVQEAAAIDAEVLVAGMGRVGTGCYEGIRAEWGDKVWGLEADSDRIQGHKEKTVRYCLLMQKISNSGSR